MIGIGALSRVFPQRVARRLATCAAFALICVSWFGLAGAPAAAAEYAKQKPVFRSHAPQLSNRLIVKLKSNSSSRGLSKEQVREEQRRPYRKHELDELRGAAGQELAELHALSDGAHVLIIPGKRDKGTLDDAIARISALASVEYVEEDKLFTPQLAPNDSYYAAGDPGLWGLYPVVPASTLPSHGRTGSYGADFETAWDTASGTGVVVAVVDGGITPHVDIVGTGGTISPATGNLVSAGYDFISDCRVRGATAVGGCVASTADSAATVAPSPDATDTGDYVSAQDNLDNPTLFPTDSISASTWHGTHIAGIIAAIGNNAAGVVGGAYGARILPVRVLGKGAGNSSDVMEGVRWAAGVHPTIPNPNPAKVINLSLGGFGSCGQNEQDAIDAATAAGAVVVVAAGNDSMDIANFVPANCNNVISVAAAAMDGSRASYSNFSSPTTNTTNPAYVTLAAPGGDIDTYDPGILSTVNASTTTPDLSATGSVYAYYDGTSMASAHVSAAVALMFSHKPDLTPAEVKNILSAPASLTPFPAFISTYGTWDCFTKKNCGAGLLNAKLAVQNTIPLLTPSPSSVDFGNQAIGSVSDATVTLTNLTPDTLAVGAATISGTGASSFTVVVDNCSVMANVGVQSTCQVTMNFTPGASGSYSAILSVPINATGVTVIGLNGTSIANPVSNSGGGGCTILRYDDHPDSSLPVTLLLALIYWLRHRYPYSRDPA